MAGQQASKRNPAFGAFAPFVPHSAKVRFAPLAQASQRLDGVQTRLLRDDTFGGAMREPYGQNFEISAFFRTVAISL